MAQCDRFAADHDRYLGVFGTMDFPQTCLMQVGMPLTPLSSSATSDGSFDPLDQLLSGFFGRAVYDRWEAP